MSGTTGPSSSRQGAWHNIVNTGEADVKLYSLYSPPEHPAETVHRTKADAEAAEHAHDE
jgi:mannose-6-phosphate isomerase-like protein (cupin superfamily)